MAEPTPNNQAALSLKWCFHLINTFACCGVRKAFISPGSRSAPITLAAIHHPQIECHAVLDERSAAFMALGSGKDTFRHTSNNHNKTAAKHPDEPDASEIRLPVPALFICTSGTAAANAYPAVIEARMSGTPLIVLSADRPPLLRKTGSSQTIDQTKLFGDYPLLFFDTGEPVDSPGDFNRLSRLAAQAFEYSRSSPNLAGSGGPVHLNLPFRKPLEPTTKQIKACVDEYHNHLVTTPSKNSPAVLSGSGHPKNKTDKGRCPEGCIVRLSNKLLPLPDIFYNLLNRCRKPLVIAGPDSDVYSSFLTWCSAHHIPVLAESGGMSSAFYLHPLLLKHSAGLDALAPGLIIRTGGEPIHQESLKALKRWKVPQIIFGNRPEMADAALSATHYLPASVQEYDWNHTKLDDTFLSPALSYYKLWKEKIEIAGRKQSGLIDSTTTFTDAHVYRTLLPIILREELCRIILSNSLPARDYFLYGAASPISHIPVLINRGASGIDGVTSTAIGSALTNKKENLLFTGDLAFFHDASALCNLKSRSIQLKIVVVNNGGGIIFRMLPFDRYDKNYTTFFEAPQEVDISSLARAHSIPYACASLPEGLEGAWNQLKKHSVGILECKTNAQASMLLRKKQYVPDN